MAGSWVAGCAQWLQVVGRSPDALLSAAERLADRGHLDEAVKLARRAIMRRPGDARLQNALGHLLYRAGDKVMAAEAHAAAITADPSCAPAYRAYIAVCQEEKRLEAARRVLQDLAVQAPSNPNPRNYLGVIDYLMGRPADALTTWQGIVHDHPGYAQAHSNLGTVLHEQGKNDQALLEFKLAIELDPRGSIGPYNNVAEIYMSRGELTQAIEYLSLAVELDPDASAVPYANLGHCYAALGRREEALRAYEASLGKTPGITSHDVRMEVLTAVAKLYLEAHRLAEARGACLEALHRSPRSVDVLSTLGEVYFREGRYELAIDCFRQALAANPMTLRNLAVHRLLSLAYYKLGHFDKAAAEYKRANAWHPDRIFGTRGMDDEAGSAEQVVARCRALIAAQPGDPALYKTAAEALFQMGCLKEAIEEYRAALELDPEDLDLLCRLGTVYYADDQGLPAVICFSRAAERNPGYAPAHLGLGLIHLLRGSVDAAIQKFQWAITIDPASAEAYNFLGNAYRQKGQPEEAWKAYRKAVDLQPTYAQAHNNLGLISLELGRPEEATRSFREALSIFPDYVPALCNLGKAQLALGKAGEARSAWRQALAINPNDPVAQSLLGEVAAGEEEPGDQGGGRP